MREISIAVPCLLARIFLLKGLIFLFKLNPTSRVVVAVGKQDKLPGDGKLHKVGVSPSVFWTVTYEACFLTCFPAGHHFFCSAEFAFWVK